MNQERCPYDRSDLVGDLCGGLTAAMLALPYGLATAARIGLPPALGVLTSILTGPVTAAIGRNPMLIGGPMISTVPILGLAVNAHGVGGAARLSMLAAAIMIAFGAMGIGRLIARVPETVLLGFSHGIGAAMVLAGLSELRHGATVVWLSVVGTSFLASRLTPRAPAPLLGLLFGVFVAHVSGTHGPTAGAVTNIAIATVGLWPSLSDALASLPAAFGLALLSSVYTVMASRVVARFRRVDNDSTSLDLDVELRAFGIANLCAACFGAPPSLGSPARSLAVIRSGASTRLANIIHSLILASLLWLGSGAISEIPQAALAAITTWMGLSLLDVRALEMVGRMRCADALAFVATAGSVLIWSGVAPVAIGCGVYAILTLRSTVWRQHSA